MIDADVAALLPSELESNAVLHSRTAFTVVVIVDVGGAVRVRVHDALPATHTFRTLLDQPPAGVHPVTIVGRGLGSSTTSRGGSGSSSPASTPATLWFELDPAT